MLPLLETLLKINGATMVKVGNFYQIMPTPAAIRQPLAIQETVQAAPDDQIGIGAKPTCRTGWAMGAFEYRKAQAIRRTWRCG